MGQIFSYMYNGDDGRELGSRAFERTEWPKMEQTSSDESDDERDSQPVANGRVPNWRLTDGQVRVEAGRISRPVQAPTRSHQGSFSISTNSGTFAANNNGDIRQISSTSGSHGSTSQNQSLFTQQSNHQEFGSGGQASMATNNPISSLANRKT